MFSSQIANIASSSTCGSWDRRKVDINDNQIITTYECMLEFGAWSTTGCKEVVIDREKNVRSCECSQLAHFGLLFVSLLVVI